MGPQLRIILTQIRIETICGADDFGGRALPTNDGTSTGWVVLGYVRKQTKQVMRTKSVTSIHLQFLHQVLPQISALTSLIDKL